MAITALYENSASISTTEYSLPNNANYASGSVKTDDGVFQVWLDLSALVAGDEYRLKIYEKVQSAGTTRVIATYTYVGDTIDEHEVLPAMIFMHGWDITLTRINGTDRTIGWSVRQVA